jgi:hypothetical protein
MPREIITKSGVEGTVAITQQKTRIWMQIAVSVLLLIAGILIITAPNQFLSHSFDEGTKRIAAGWIGLVVGYWLS